MNLIALAVLGAICVLGAVALGISAILREQKQRRQFHERLLLVAASYMRVNEILEMGRGAPARSARLTWALTGVAALFGYDPAHPDHYVMRWWIVLGLALIPARLIAELVEIFAGTWSLLLVPVAWVLLCRFVFHWSEERRRNLLYAQFPDALQMVVRAVRVGIPLTEGIRAVASEGPPPTGPEFALLHDRTAIGVTLEDALREMAGRNSLPEYQFFATALALQSRTGGGLTEALEGLADVMRRRLALKARGLALAAEAKTSIMILASLPFISGAALAVLSPQYIGRMFYDPGCEKMLLAAIGLLSTGLLVMRGMIRKALS